MATKVNGKSKGNSFERKISNVLSDRFKEYLGQDKGFRRNPDSGSFFGGSNKQRAETHNTDYAVFGDLICPKLFKFSVECKHYKSAPTFNSIITGGVTQWDNWLKQADQDSNQSRRRRLLIIKYNNVDEFVFVHDPIPELSLKHVYKGNYAYLLKDLLSLPDNYFFD